MDDGPVDELGVVERAELVEDLEVFLEEARGGPPVGASPGLGGELREVGRLEAEAPRPGQQGPDLVGEPAGAQGDRELLGPLAQPVGPVADEQLAHHDVLLGTGQQPQGAPGVLGRPRLPRQGVGEGVEGPRRLRLDGATQPGGDPVAQLLRRPPGEREGEDAVRRGPRLDPGGDRGDERGRLARARAGEHEQRTVTGGGHRVDDGLLGLVEAYVLRLAHHSRDQPERRLGPPPARLHGPTEPDGTDT